MNPGERKIELTLPAHPEMMVVVRLTTAGVLARAGLTIEAMDDVKLAAEEACNCLVRSSGCSSLKVDYVMESNRFALHAQVVDCGCGCVERAGLSDEEISVIRCVLLSLVDEVELSFDDRCLRGISMRKRLPE